MGERGGCCVDEWEKVKDTVWMGGGECKWEMLGDTVWV